MEPFYFRSFDKVVGTAHNLTELESEIRRIGEVDPNCVNWHLQQGHLVAWLNYIGEHAVAEMLKDVKNYKEALSRLREYRVVATRSSNKASKRRRR